MIPRPDPDGGIVAGPAESGGLLLAPRVRALPLLALLLGVVPVHLYSREEKKDLERVKKEIISAIKKLKKMLADKGIPVSEIVRSGYPDEEILKTAGEHAVSLILLPSGSTVPSELSKAVAIILEESEQLKWPVFLLPSADAA